MSALLVDTFTTLRVFSVVNSGRMQCQVSTTGKSQLTQISPNRTVTPATSEGAEEISQRSLASIKAGADVISPTAIWTDAVSENASPKEETRQMPLLRRSSDKSNNLSHSASPQDGPKPQSVGTSVMNTDTQAEKRFKKGAGCEQLPEGDAKSDLNTRNKDNDYVQSKAEDALKVTGDEDGYVGSPRDTLVCGSKPLRNESGGNRIGEGIVKPPKNTAGFDDVKPKGTYTDTANVINTPCEALAQDILASFPAMKQKVHQQQVVGPSKAQCARSDGDVHMDGVEIDEVKLNTASHRLGVKKDLVSKSCPPKLRTTSPKIKGMSGESRERNQKVIQRATPSRMRESSHTGKSRNRIVVGDESGPAEPNMERGQNDPDPEVSQLTQQMQDLKGVEHVDEVCNDDNNIIEHEHKHMDERI